jgi:hypothetical protein
VEPLHNLGIHTLLQYLSVVVGDRLEAGVLESIIDHFLGGVVEGQAGCVLVNIILQTKMFLHKEKQLNLSNREINSEIQN